MSASRLSGEEGTNAEVETFTDKLGLHWIIDGVDCAFAQLDDQEHLRSVLASIPDALRLTRVGDVQVFAHEEEDETTLAGIVLIAESHLSIHVRPHLRTIHADLFSCKPFDVSAALDLLRAAYRFSNYEESVIERGKLREGRVG